MTSPNQAPDSASPQEVNALLACLPHAMQAERPSITRLSRGNSGAGVYIVETGSASMVLKQTSAHETPGQWQTALAMQRAAADAGVAPKVIHTDEARRAVLSEHVQDRSFAALYGNPATRADALALLGGTLRTIHDIPTASSQAAVDPVAVLEQFQHSARQACVGMALPELAEHAWRELALVSPPISDRPAVLCHNDLNPTNIVYDGARLVLLDWQTAAVNNPYYDLGTIALFLRMDREAELQLLSAYDGVRATDIHPSFRWNRRMAAALSGTAFLTAFLTASRSRGYAPLLHSSNNTTIPTLTDFYAELRNGARTMGTPESQWMFGLVLLNESLRIGEMQ